MARLSAPAWIRQARPSIVDFAVAGAFTLLGQVEIWTSDAEFWRPRGAVIALVVTVPVALRRRAALAAALAVAVGVWLLPASLDLPLFAFFTPLLVCHSVAAYAEVRPAMVGGVALAAPLWIGWVLDRLQHDNETNPGDLVFITVIFGGAWAFGRMLRERRLRTSELTERAHRLEAERELEARAAVAEERSRIARELHDVVAHSVTVMVIQAGAAEELLDRSPERVREPLAVIRETGRQALVEMRRLLGVLRQAGDELLLAPPPTLTQLEGLILQAEDAGLTVQLNIEGRERTLAAGVDLAAYRIIQEALTNTLKHAGPTRAHVSVRYGDSTLDLEVLDEGVGLGRSVAGGHGLIGMRERVALYGGSLETGSANGHGFRVRASLPIESIAP